MDDHQESEQQKQPNSPTFHHSSSSSNNLSTTNNSPGSPRRRKGPIDLDAALYLQSQAALVQTPNKKSTTTTTTSTSSSTIDTTEGSCVVVGGGFTTTSNLISNSNPNIQIQPQQGFSVAELQRKQQPVNSNNNFRLSTISLQQQPPQPKSPLKVNQSNNIWENNQNTCGTKSFDRFSSLRQSSLSFPAGIYNDHYHRTDYSNEISVDYIDCVSNNDLANHPTTTTMRGIPHCKKHLRFHRNRIDPSTTTNNSASDPMCVGNHSTELSGNNNNKSTTNSNETSSITTTINSEDFSSQINTNNTHPEQPIQSVLYPISINDVKKRTYFAETLNQDSLLGPDELHRYFPTGRVNIFVSTWNQNRKRAPLNLSDLLLPDKLINMPDIYAIAIQEAFSYQADYLKEWEIELQSTLGPSHVLLHSCSLGVLHLALFVRRDLIWFCSTPEESVYNSRSMPTNMIKTKGAVSIAFRFFGTSFMFTNCHFPAHENRLKDRIDEYQKIIKSIDLPKNLKLLKPRYLSNDSTARFDCVFFLGDLNFRLEHRTFEETVAIMDDIFQQKEPSYEPLTQNDELIKVMESGQAFHGFDESPIKFPPTYKFLAQTNKYDKQSKRVPSYTDRILFRSKRQRHIQCLIYDWLPQLLSSDHKPVFCLFSVLIRPGSQLNNMVKTLNAGLFQRNIYLEALKRRAENPDGCMLEKDGANGGSVICTIS